MPIDASGNRAEIIMDDVSTIKRMNIGRLYEQYINASCLATQTRTRQLYNRGEPAEINNAWEYLTGFYRIVAPLMMQHLPTQPEDQIAHLQCVIQNGVFLYTPTDNPVSYRDVIRELRVKYPACYGSVTYRGMSGRVVPTVNNILIGGMYMMLLEKTGNTWAGVSSAKLQHFGVPAKITNADKYAYPVRQQPVRIYGESEMRLIAAVCGGDTAAELLDQTNSPTVHASVVHTLLHAQYPTHITVAAQRDTAPRHNGRIVTLINHMLECGGIEFVREEAA